MNLMKSSGFCEQKLKLRANNIEKNVYNNKYSLGPTYSFYVYFMNFYIFIMESSRV